MSQRKDETPEQYRARQRAAYHARRAGRACKPTPRAGQRELVAWRKAEESKTRAAVRPCAAHELRPVGWWECGTAYGGSLTFDQLAAAVALEDAC